MLPALFPPLFTHWPTHPARRRAVLAGAVAWLLAGGALAQEGVPASSADPGADAPLALRATPMLPEALPDQTNQMDQTDAPPPLSVRADRLSGRAGLETVLEGQAELRRPGLVLQADRLEYDHVGDIARGQGQLRLNRAGNRYTGTEGQMRVEAFEGFVRQPTYQFLANGAHGQAERIDFLDPDRAVIHQGDYTTCRRGGPGWAPDWLLRADRLELDQEDDTGRAQGAVLEFKGVPILPLPAMSFPLSAQRKSGWLPPTIGLDNTSGLNLAVPYYWNIAPHRDATFTPALMSKRGLDLAAQFRYLEDDYSGEVNANVLPGDRLRHRTRWGLFTRHHGIWHTGWRGVGALGLHLNLNRVSDDDYWRDFSHRGMALTTRLLASEGGLHWGRGDFSLSARALKWQTLQDAAAPIVPPYDRLPQLTGRWAGMNAAGSLDYAVEADFTRFRALAALTGQPNADRAFVHAQIARPWTAPWGFLTPRLQWHASHYRFDRALAGGGASHSRALPTVSLDGGLVFERDTRYFGHAWRQTLEPRLMYVYTPYRDQSRLPNYDSGPYDFNFATLWAANAFAGHDRVVDNNLVTFGLTSRLLDPATGAEAVRLALAQRYRFSPQRVTLPGGTPAGKGLSDMMLGAGIQWNPRWAFDAVAQYNLDTRESTRTTVAARYTPGDYRTLNLAYRRERELGTQQFDMSWQWPLHALWRRGASGAAGGGGGSGDGAACHGGRGRWYSVGRLNYSVPERKLVDAVLGLEYDAGCWVGRLVASRLQSTSTSSNKSLMFQLEFRGLARLGNNPLHTLRNNIPHYRLLREETVSPSRFTHYD